MQPFHDMLKSVWAKPMHYNGHESNDDGGDDKDAFLDGGCCHCVLYGKYFEMLSLLIVVLGGCRRAILSTTEVATLELGTVLFVKKALTPETVLNHAWRVAYKDIQEASTVPNKTCYDL